LFSHFIPCGVWEAVYIIEGLLKNSSDIQPDTVHADTQGQSLPVFGLGALLGFDLLPRIRNWHELVFYRPDEQTRYSHIDTLFGEDAVDWDLIETHWSDLLRTAISIRENRLSSVTLLRRLGNHSRKNRLYRAFRELGRAVRTITLLRYLSEPQLREQITAITNRNEAFHGFADWLMFGGKLIGHNDPDHQEKVIKFNELLANSLLTELRGQFSQFIGHVEGPVATVPPRDRKRRGSPGSCAAGRPLCRVVGGDWGSVGAVSAARSVRRCGRGGHVLLPGSAGGGAHGGHCPLLRQRPVAVVPFPLGDRRSMGPGDPGGGP
jgi:hypothetical protein